MKTVTNLLFILLTKKFIAWPLQRVLNRLSNGYPWFMSGEKAQISSEECHFVYDRPYMYLVKICAE